jgi:hypothetical protein
MVLMNYLSPLITMKLFITVILLLTFTAASKAQIKLSDKARISVITCGPGQDQVYVAFGHSAIRVQDPVRKIDQVYNYGVFDFSQKNFYLNFARGHNYYRLASYPFEDFEFSYIYYNRFIHQQVLNLTTEQNQKLFDYLEWNALPQNQQYLYDYFYDNCATRIRDVVAKVLGDSVAFDDSHITTDYTIRELTDLYLTYQPWGDLGIDICLGLPMDKKASPYEYMFLPDYIESSFAHATIKRNGTTAPLVQRSFTVFEPKDPPAYSNGIFQPVYVFALLFLIAAIITARDYSRNKLTNWFDITLFSIVGLVGLLLLLLWIATDHRAAAKNFNLLWALPTHIIAVFAFIRQPKWLRYYFGAVVVLEILLLISWPFLPQKLHYALIPLVMAIALRAFIQFRLRRRNEAELTGG